MDRITSLDGFVFNELGEKPIDGFSDISRLSAAEGMVLLKNDNSVLPLEKNQNISVFGRTQFDYYKSGTGSGGSIVTEYVSNYIDGLKLKSVNLNESLMEKYISWIAENPFDKGNGWATEPFFQKEMPLDENDLSDARKFSDTAIVFIGRLAGECRDLESNKGAYYLAQGEEELLSSVTKHFSKVCVVLNIGNILDFSWIEKYKIPSVLIAWQGGMEGGNACADVLCGDIPACGKLTDTIAKEYRDYKSSDTFEKEDTEIIYDEDIYVGYRYFETFAKDRVLFPFGYGLTYTDFEISNIKAESDDKTIRVFADVKNIGSYSGKQILQLYYSAPQGELGKPAIELGGFYKTKSLMPGESESVTVTVNIDDMASYDDSGITGFAFCDVLEKGDYNIYLGTDVKNVDKVYTYTLNNTKKLKQYESALAPVKAFKRLRPADDGNGGFTPTYEDVPLRTYNLQERVENDGYKELAYTGNVGIKLYDVYNGKNTIDEFIAQLSNQDLTDIVKGEGMNSIKTTAGTTGIIGGVTPSLRSFGIPILNLSDGPSGIRMLTGSASTRMPCGTQLACTWNKSLVHKLYRFEGIEMRTHKMDVLLGPGMNIHRNPLNGRNFEYFSEDPYLTGVFATEIISGIRESGSDATAKHFYANNREAERNKLNSVMSERASREIYLKSFEMTVKNGLRSIMTSYNAVNGIWNAGNYDLNTFVLRNQWGFDGLVMTDWWATMNDEGKEANNTNLAAMVKAQNDAYMLANDSQKYNDNLKQALSEGKITTGILQRCAANICKFIIGSAAMQRYIDDGFKTIGAIPDTLDGYKTICVLDNPKCGVGYNVESEFYGVVILKLTYSSENDSTAQNQIHFQLGETPACNVMVAGTSGAINCAMGAISLKKGTNVMRIRDDCNVDLKKIEVLSNHGE